jgi:cytochrome P450 / NADPH-cytochrome P450 reductase
VESEKKKDQEDKYPITDEGIVDDIITFMIAGTETTSNFLVAMIFYIFEKPDVARRLKEEIDSVIETNEDIYIEKFKKLRYLECIFLEISRLFTSVPLSF